MRPARHSPDVRVSRRWRPARLAFAAVLGAAVVAVAWPVFAGWQERRAVRALLPDPNPALRDSAPAFAGALRLLDARARTDRNAVHAAAELARLYEANWRSGEATVLYEALASRLEPKNPRWAYALAGLLGARGDLAGARRWLERGVDLDPTYLPARLKLAEVCSKSGDATTARAALLSANDAFPRHPHVLLALARSESDASRARHFAEAAVAADPEFSPGWSWLAESYAGAGRAADSIVARDKAVSGRKPTDLEDPWASSVLEVCFDPDRLRVAAAVAATSRRLDRASTLIDRALELAPRDAAVLRERGRIRRAGDDWREARRSFALAVQLEPANADNWANLHEAELRDGDPTAATRSLDEGLRLHPQSPGLRLASARRFAATGRPEEALREFRETIRLRPQEAIARIELASLLFKLDAVAEGVAELRTALDAEPDHPLALSTLAFVHIGLGQEEPARHWLRRARTQQRLPRADLAALERKFREQFHSEP